MRIKCDDKPKMFAINILIMMSSITAFTIPIKTRCQSFTALGLRPLNDWKRKWWAHVWQFPHASKRGWLFSMTVLASVPTGPWRSDVREDTWVRELGCLNPEVAGNSESGYAWRKESEVGVKRGHMRHPRGSGSWGRAEKGGIWAEAMFWKQQLEEEAGGHGGGQGSWEMRSRCQRSREAKECKESRLTLEGNMSGWMQGRWLSLCPPSSHPPHFQGRDSDNSGNQALLLPGQLQWWPCDLGLANQISHASGHNDWLRNGIWLQSEPMRTNPEPSWI